MLALSTVGVEPLTFCARLRARARPGLEQAHAPPRRRRLPLSQRRPRLGVPHLRSRERPLLLASCLSRGAQTHRQRSSAAPSRSTRPSRPTSPSRPTASLGPTGPSMFPRGTACGTATRTRRSGGSRGRLRGMPSGWARGGEGGRARAGAGRKGRQCDELCVRDRAPLRRDRPPSSSDAGTDEGSRSGRCRRHNKLCTRRSSKVRTD